MITVSYAHTFTPDGTTNMIETVKTTPQAERLVSDQLEKLQRDLQQLKLQLRHAQKLATLGTAAAMLAHEFNNIMTPIMGYAQFALNRKDPEMMVKALEITMTQAELARTMSQRILNMSADEPIAFGSVPLGDIIEGSSQALCRDLEKDGLQLKCDFEADIRVLADAKQLQLVFVNLFLNARDAMAERSGQITVSANVDDDRVVIRFTDTGPGVPADVIDRIFDPFFSTKNGQPGSGGSGLGLALCHEIIEEHRGSISVESTPGNGTTFVISLPSAR